MNRKGHKTDELGMEFPSLSDASFLESVFQNQFSMDVLAIKGFSYNAHFTFNGANSTSLLTVTNDMCPAFKDTYYFITGFYSVIYVSLAGTSLPTWTKQYVGGVLQSNMPFASWSLTSASTGSNHSNLLLKQLTLNPGSGLTSGNIEYSLLGYRVIAC